MKRKLVAVLTAVLMVSTIFTGCGAQEEEQKVEQQEVNKGDQLIKAENPEKLPQVAKDRKDTLIVGMTAPKGQFCPIYSGEKYDSWVNDLIFSKLISNDKENKPMSDIATWELSEDNKTYTFKLKSGIKFSNGEELTAEDVEFTFTALADPKYDGPRAYAVQKLDGYAEYNKGDAKKVSGIKVIDKYTIEFTNKEVSSPAIWNFEMGIMPKSVYNFEKGNISVLKDKFLEPVGSGPYKFEYYKQGQEVKVVKNDNYFDGAPKIPNIIMKTVNGQTAIQELTSGSVDMEPQSLSGRPENINPLKDAGFLNMNLYPQNGYSYLCLNMKDPMLSDQKVRQALNYGIDRQGFIDMYYQGYGQVLNSPMLPSSWAYNDELNKYEHDTKKAEELLDQAGWKRPSEGATREKDGEKLKISWLVSADNKYVDALVPVVQENLKEIGVEIVPELLEFGALSSKVREERKFQMSSMSWSLSSDPDQSDIFGIDQDVPGGFNSGGWRNEKADSLLKDGIKEFDQEKRKEVYKEWQKIFNDELPYIIIGNGKDMAVANTRVKNFEPSTYMEWTRNIHKLELEQE